MSSEPYGVIPDFHLTVLVALSVLERNVLPDCSNIAEFVDILIDTGCPEDAAMAAAERVCRRRDYMISQRALRTRIMDSRLWRQKRATFA